MSKSKGASYLIHAGVGEKQRGIIQRDGGRRVDVRVLIATEEVNELLADLSAGQRGVHVQQNCLKGSRKEERGAGE